MPGGAPAEAVAGSALGGQPNACVGAEGLMRGWGWGIIVAQALKRFGGRVQVFEARSSIYGLTLYNKVGRGVTVDRLTLQ